MSEPEPEGEYSLLMPFITVVSNGGPHDDESYTAGYAMGLLDVYLRIGKVEDGVPVRQDSIAQADLLAMRYGYSMTIEPDTWSGWCWATFTRADSL